MPGMWPLMGDCAVRENRSQDSDGLGRLIQGGRLYYKQVGQPPGEVIFYIAT